MRVYQIFPRMYPVHNNSSNKSPDKKGRPGMHPAGLSIFRNKTYLSSFAVTIFCTGFEVCLASDMDDTLLIMRTRYFAGAN